mmetsp:Transcript_20115/g.47288  ORF Transcript_20115/g.47288 Transcript_20115/m.47288 type:complete len:278 (+) Transcript_20115:100-933(+)
MASQVVSSSTTRHGLLAYGVRRIRPDTLPLFQRDFDAWIESRQRDLNVAFAFPDAADANLLHILFWTKGKDAGVLAELKSDALAKSDDVSDGLFHVFGSDSSAASEPARRSAVLRHTHHITSLAGYMRPGPSEWAGKSPPMIGVFRRAILPGKSEALAKSFKSVCDIWCATVPGILAAMVAPDPKDDNYVYDIRIFADKASYDGHVDKTNADLVRAMDVWFSHYDTSIPHRGAMFGTAEDTSDPAMHSSSVKDRPIKVDFNIFHYGKGGCMGRCCLD